MFKAHLVSIRQNQYKEKLCQHFLLQTGNFKHHFANVRNMFVTVFFSSILITKEEITLMVKYLLYLTALSLNHSHMDLTRKPSTTTVIKTGDISH